MDGENIDLGMLPLPYAYLVIYREDIIRLRKDVKLIFE